MNATVVAPRDDVLDVYRRHVSRGRASLAQLMAAPMEERASGSHVHCDDGRSYLDCGGYGVFLLGHCHPAVVAAVVDQVRRNPLATNVLLEPRLAQAAADLSAVTPPGLDYVQLLTSGAHAVETALKLARAHGKRTIVAAHNAYHGKTLGALSATPNPSYQDQFRPLLPAEYVPFGDAPGLRGVLERRGDCCVIVEPVQGEGGVVLPPDGYLAEVERLCRAHGAMLVVDEIQTGLGRLGSWWGIEREGVLPDVLLVGKGLSGGVVPVAAVAATEEAFAPFSHDPVLHTSTFAGSPLAAAAASAAIAVLREERLIERADALGRELLARLDAQLRVSCPEEVVAVRGRGLLLGIEFAEPGLVAEFALALLERGVIVNHSLNANAVLRLTPPAVMSDADVELLMTAIADAARSVRSRLAEHNGYLGEATCQ